MTQLLVLKNMEHKAKKPAKYYIKVRKFSVSNV